MKLIEFAQKVEKFEEFKKKMEKDLKQAQEEKAIVELKLQK